MTIASTMRKKRKEAETREKRAQEHRALARFYNLNSILGNNWAMFYVIIGGRMTGKSYSLAEFLCRQKEKLKGKVKNYWMRISETSTKALLSNEADKAITSTGFKYLFNLINAVTEVK